MEGHLRAEVEWEWEEEEDFVFNDAAQKVFSIDLIIQSILSNLTELRDLKSFRLINRKCNERVLTNFMAKSIVSCPHLADSDDVNMWKYPTSLSWCESFEDLFQCIMKSQNFPCTSIKIRKNWYRNFHSPSCQKFYAFYGEKIQRLELGTDVSVEFFALKMMLMSHFPSVTILVLENTNFRNDEGYRQRCLPESACLKNLKVLISRIPMTTWNLIVVEDIIQAAPNLQLLGGFEVEMFDSLVKAKKTDLIETLRFIPKLSNLNLLRKFAGSKPKLKNIHAPVLVTTSDLPGIAEDAGNIMSLLLESSKDSLQNLCLAVGAYSNLTLPVFTQITTICWRVILNLRYCLDNASDLSDKLPVLRTVIVDESIPTPLLEQPEVQQIFFETMPTVKELVIKCEKISKEFMEGLSYKFLNAEEVKIDWGILKQGSEFFWILPQQVRRIEIRDFCILKYQDLLLESFLVGIPRKVCKFMQKLDKESINLGVVATLSTVRNLKCLNSLKFYCSDFPCHFKSAEYGFFSKLTKWFVLDEMTNFKLHVAFPQSLFFQRDFFSTNCKGFPEFEPISKDIVISYWDDSRDLKKL